jgi:hypothetical protein
VKELPAFVYYSVVETGVTGSLTMSSTPDYVREAAIPTNMKTI